MSQHNSPASLIRPHIRQMKAYTPGLQLNDPQIVKLNTNENPFPPAPTVVEALRAEAVANRLQLYPEPTSRELREKLARLSGQKSDWLLIGNGSDEVLALLFRAFVPPDGIVVTATPTYSLYHTLADMLPARLDEVALRDDWQMDLDVMLNRAHETGSSLTIITNPNAPTGVSESRDALLNFARHNPGMTLIDEAYVEFGADSLASEAGSTDYPRLMVSSTFSKSYSLAGQRIGWLVAHPEVIIELDKIRDSYNLSRLAQATALAALSDRAEHKRRLQQVIEDREYLRTELDQRQFNTLPSKTNFLFSSPPDGDAERLYGELLERKILVRYFRGERTGRFLRITIGRRDQLDALLTAIDNTFKDRSDYHPL